MGVEITPECPRCGYDLSGLPPTWKEACPLDGICSECGYGFAWGDVYSDENTAPDWFLETREGILGRLFPRRHASMMLRPWVFWKEIGLRAPFRPGRILYLDVAFLAMAIVFTVVFGTLVERYITRVTPAAPTIVLDGYDELKAQLAFVGHRIAYGYSNAAIPSVRLVLLVIALAPLGLVGMYATRRTVRFRWRHVVRAWLYSLAGAQVALCLLYFQLFFFYLYAAIKSQNPNLLPGPSYLINFNMGTWIGLSIGLWLVAFWYFFFRDHLRLDHPKYATGATLLIAVFAALTTDVFINDSWWHTLFFRW